MLVTFNQGGRTREAMLALQAGRLQDAERLCLAVLAAVPREPDALHLMGLICHRTDRPGEALALLQQAVLTAPRHATALTDLAEILRGQNRLEVAEAIADRAVAAGPGLANAHHVRARIRAQQGMLVAALESAGRALTLDPLNGTYHATAGTILFHLAKQLGTDAPGERGARCREAAQHLEAAVRRDSRQVTACVQLAMCYEELNEPERACEVYRHALSLQPKDPAIWTGFAGALARVGRWAEAEGACRELLRIDSKHAGGQEMLKKIEGRKG